MTDARGLALWAVVGVCAAAALPACKTHGDQLPMETDGAVTLGGRSVTAAQLRRGGEIYTHYCRNCHAASGSGRGPSAPGLRPPPRNLRIGVYKFASVPAGQLPTDADFRRIIKGGLHGTAMLPWDIPDSQVDDLIQYVKLLAVRWRTESAGEPITVSPDPWGARAAEAIERGEKVYHGLAQCAVACHPNYISKPEIFQHTKELTGMLVTQFRADLYAPVSKDSDYGFKILPPDFTWTAPRSGDTLPDIYRSIAAGIGGTAMPTWKEVLPEEDLWAMARYVKSLVALRGTAEASALRERLLAQPAWIPPPPPAAEGVDGGRRD